MKRIEALASLVDKDALVLDIGTDHAYLPIYLYLNNITKNIVGSDISKKAIDSANNNLSKYGLNGKIPLVVSDGFKSIHGHFDIAVISGVGTETIKKILAGNDIPNTLIISSHKDIYGLRKYMNRLGYKIDKELVIYENNKYYNIIKYQKEKEVLNEYQLLVGLSNNLEYTIYLLEKYKRLYKLSNDKVYLKYIEIIEKKLD